MPSAWLLRSALLCCCLLAPLSPATGQGCSQCRESVGQTPARTQIAYRRGIVVLVVAGTGIFVATLATLRRFR